MTSCSTIEAPGGKKRRRGWSSELPSLSSQVIVTYNAALVLWRHLNTCLLRGRGKWISYFDLCAAFAFSIKLSISQPMSFIPFTFPILYPVPLSGDWVNACVGLSSWPRLSYNRPLSEKQNLVSQYSSDTAARYIIYSSETALSKGNNLKLSCHLPPLWY